MGEMAEAILMGEFCQTCGEHIGDPCGYPVNCAGCSGESVAMTVKRYEKRRDKKRKIRNAELEIIKKVCKEKNVKIKFIHQWHLRLSKQDMIVDVYPTTRKYFDLKRQYWGKYQLIEALLNDKLRS